MWLPTTGQKVFTVLQPRRRWGNVTILDPEVCPISNDIDAMPWLTWQVLHPGHPPDPIGLAHLALRTRTPDVMTALVHAVGAGYASEGRLQEAVLRGAAGPSSRAAERHDWWLAVAFVWAGLDRRDEDLAAAALIVQELSTTDTVTQMEAPLQLAALQILFLAGHHHALAQVLPQMDRLHPDGALYLEIDLANPFLPGPPGTSGASGSLDPWLDKLSTRFVDRGLSPIRLLPEDGERLPFDRLNAESDAGSAGGDLVTVVMPCWRPDEGLLTSVRSIVSQSYGDLEIILVDDASGPEFQDVFRRAEAIDPRIRTLRMSRNGGSYLGRRAAIAESSGSYITFQDSDDWSHPSRIEKQVKALEESPEAPMSRSRAVRAKDDLTHQWLGYRSIRDNASSLLFHRSLLEATGGFLPIRKGADSEFIERVTTVMGPVKDVKMPLAITRLRTGSLSRGDFTFSWMAPDRRAFRAAFMAWHRQLRELGETPSKAGTLQHADGMDYLPFPVPLAWVRGLDSAAQVTDHYADVYLGDFSQNRQQPWHQWVLNQVQHGTDPVALWHQLGRNQVGLVRPELDTSWDPALLSGRVGLISRVDGARADRVIVLDPGVLPLLSTQQVRVEAHQVQIWLTPEHVTPGPSGLPEDLLGAGDLVRALWGGSAMWQLAPWLDENEQAEVLAALPHLDIGMSPVAV